VIEGGCQCLHFFHNLFVHNRYLHCVTVYSNPSSKAGFVGGDDDGILGKTAILGGERVLDERRQLWVPNILTSIHFRTLNICIVIGQLTLLACVALD